MTKIEQIAEEIFTIAVAEAPHAEWDHIWWDEMTDEEKKPFLDGAHRIIRLTIDAIKQRR